MHKRAAATLTFLKMCQCKSYTSSKSQEFTQALIILRFGSTKQFIESNSFGPIYQPVATKGDPTGHIEKNWPSAEEEDLAASCIRVEDVFSE